MYTVTAVKYTEVRHTKVWYITYIFTSALKILARIIKCYLLRAVNHQTAQ